MLIIDVELSKASNVFEEEFNWIAEVCRYVGKISSFTLVGFC